MASRRDSSSMLSVAPAPFFFPVMPLTPSHEYPTEYQDDSAPRPSRPSPSQRFLFQMLPVQAPPPQHIGSRQPTSYVASFPQGGSSSAAVTAQQESSAGPSATTTPPKSSLRLSHPPPAPLIASLQQLTPQSKRARLSDNDSRSATAGISPLSQSSNAIYHSNGSSAPTGPLSSPSPHVRPLSGISRPLPAPPTPSPSQRSVRFNTGNTPLIPMPQRSIEDFEKLLPQRQPAAVRPPRTDVPHRALLQAIPPQPQPPRPIYDAPVAQDVGPLRPVTETLPRRNGWSLTGFRSFDLDLERIADVVSLEQAHSGGPDEPQAEGGRSTAVDTSHQASRNGPRMQPPHLGHSDRGLPSGSILEVLGPPASGKSSLVLQFAVTERLRALGRAREALMMPDEDADASMERKTGLNGGNDGDGTVFNDSCYFLEDFWDAEIATADQVLVIDCEGALTPEKIADAAWTAVISLWASTQQQHHPADARASLKEQRSEVPEEVRRLVAAVLAGIHVSRVTRVAGLIALLHSLRPTDELQDGQMKKVSPSAMPPRTSLILIDSLSYHIRSSGGSSQDRKVAAQVTERIREMLLRVQKPFEYRLQPELSVEEQEAARQRCREAAAKLCTPTIVFTNQLGIRRGRNELDTSGRGSPSGRSAMGMGSGRPFNKNNPRGEGTSMLAPLLNGVRPPQSTRIRDERPAPSVALCGPEMWEGEEQAVSDSPRRLQHLSGRNFPTQPMGHDRGWPPSFLGQDVWRMLLFRHGSLGHRYAQMVSVPPAIQSELSALWSQTREHVRARAAAANDGAQQPVPPNLNEEEQGALEARQGEQQQTEVPAALFEKQAGENKDKQMLELLNKLRASLFRWRPFHVSSRGLVS